MSVRPSAGNVLGVAEVTAKLLAYKDKTFKRVVEAIEKTAVRMANHAKAGHEHGSDPHSRGRFETQTANLVNSVSPGGPGGQEMRWEEISEDRIVGLFGIVETAPTASMHYGPYVEEKYPFIFPAAMAHVETFEKELATAANPDAK